MIASDNFRKLAEKQLDLLLTNWNGQLRELVDRPEVLRQYRKEYFYNERNLLQASNFNQTRIRKTMMQIFNDQQLEHFDCRPINIQDLTTFDNALYATAKRPYYFDGKELRYACEGGLMPLSQDLNITPEQHEEILERRARIFPPDLLRTFFLAFQHGYVQQQVANKARASDMFIDLLETRSFAILLVENLMRNAVIMDKSQLRLIISSSEEYRCAAEQYLTWLSKDTFVLSIADKDREPKPNENNFEYELAIEVCGEEWAKRAKALYDRMILFFGKPSEWQIYEQKVKFDREAWVELEAMSDELSSLMAY